MTDQELDNLLAVIGSTESTSFNEFCSAYPNTPEPGDTPAWRNIFDLIRDAERRAYIEVTRTGKNIDGMILTEAGANRIRERLDKTRGLLGLLS